MVLVAACGGGPAGIDAGAPDARPDAALPAQLMIAPSVADFGAVGLGCATAPLTATITNTGGLTTSTLTAGITSSATADFMIASDTCTAAALAPRAACAIRMEFGPTTPGSRTASLIVSAGATMAVVNMVGTGLAAAPLAVSPAALAFGTVAPGAASTKSFTVSNLGCATTGALTVQLAGSDPGAFSIATSACATAALAIGQSCTVDIVFAPLTTSAKTASVTVGGSSGGFVTVALTGD